MGYFENITFQLKLEWQHFGQRLEKIGLFFSSVCGHTDHICHRSILNVVTLKTFETFVLPSVKHLPTNVKASQGSSGMGYSYSKKLQ